MSSASTVLETTTRVKVSAANPTAGQHGWLTRLGAYFERRREVKKTIRELDACSDRELRDLGIFRSDIEAIARKAASAL